MQEFLVFDESFDSCLTATLTLFLSSTTPRSVCLLSIPFALTYRTLNVMSSLIYSADGAGVGVVRVVIAVSFRPSRGRRSNLYFSDTVRKISTSDVSVTYRTGVLGSRA